MPYVLTWSEEADYLHFRVTGENTPENVQGYLEQIRAECVERGSVAILIEENLHGPRLRLLDIYRVVSEAVERHLPTIRAVAFVDVHVERAPENVEFGETLAYNRRVNVRRFGEVGAAAVWLRGLGATS